MERPRPLPFASSLSRVRSFAFAFFAPFRAFRDPGALLLLLALAGLVALRGLRAPELAPVAAGRLDPGPAFLDGLYGPEAHGDGYEYRWTSGAALVQLRGFGRSILNGRYHETRLTRYWRRFVLKDLLLALVVHPLEERFDKSDPLYVMFTLRKP